MSIWSRHFLLLFNFTQVYHSFHDEVDVYRQHWWRCSGPCQSRKPYFGYVKRAMNRAPSRLDPWWEDHQRTCGGTYTKVKEPEGYRKKTKKETKTSEKKNVVNGKPSEIVKGDLFLQYLGCSVWVVLTIRKVLKGMYYANVSFFIFCVAIWVPAASTKTPNMNKNHQPAEGSLLGCHNELNLDKTAPHL